MLKLKGISKTYGQRKALDSIDLELPSKGFFSILGPSGCGKTTLLSVIGLMLSPTSGSYQLGGQETSSLKEGEKVALRQRAIGYIHQEYDLISSLNVHDNVALPLLLKENDPNGHHRVEELLNNLGIQHLAKQKTAKLSGGEKQRVAIARALVNDPSIILADEPTGALDSKSSEEVMAILKDISKTKLVIMVTHNEELAATSSDSIIRMKDGKILDQVKIGDGKKVPPLRKKGSAFSSFKLAFKNVLSKRRSFLTLALVNLIGIGAMGVSVAIGLGKDKMVGMVEDELLSALPIEVAPYYLSSIDRISNISISKPLYGDIQKVLVEKSISTTGKVNDISSNYIEYIKSNIADDQISYRYSTQGSFVGLDQAGSAYVVDASSSSEVETFANSLFEESAPFMEMPLPSGRALRHFDILEGRYPVNRNEALLLIRGDNTIPESLAKTLGHSGDIDFSAILGKDFRFVANDDIYLRNPAPRSVNGYFLKDQQTLAEAGMTPKKVETYMLEGAFAYLEGDSKKVEESMNAMRSMFEDEPSTRNLYSYSKVVNEPLLKSLYHDDSKGEKLEIVGILRPKEDTIVSPLQPGIYYEKETTQMFMEANKDSEIAREMYQHLVYQEQSSMLKIPDMYGIIDSSAKNGFSSVLEALGAIYSHFSSRSQLASDLEPASISISPEDIRAKQEILRILDRWNEGKPSSESVEYIDLGSSIQDIVFIFTSVFDNVLLFIDGLLVVSTLIINALICLLDMRRREKEIGLYRSLGASKATVGFGIIIEKAINAILASMIGSILSLFLIGIVNAMVEKGITLIHISSFAFLSPLGWLEIVIISSLTVVLASLFPAIKAASKDPMDTIKNSD